MENFFQILRDIQNKERNTGTLSEIEDSFYDDASKYLQDLLKTVDENPLSLEAYQLRDSQRITIEICERREFKIISTAIANVQKAHDIFKGEKQDSDLYDVVPYNTTPEEEKLYKDIIDVIIDYRKNLMSEIIPNKNRKNKTKIGFKPKTQKTEISEEVNNAPVIENPQYDEIPEQPVEPPRSESQQPEVETTKESSKIKQPTLDESQVAMMFGAVPEEILLDDENQPIKPKSPTDITTPFEPPKVPKDDTVTLQNASSEKDKSEDTSKLIEDTISTDTASEMEDVSSELDSEELVEFKKEIVTDILDEEELTYGPFDVKDMAILPASIVNILKNKEVIDIIK